MSQFFFSLFFLVKWKNRVELECSTQIRPLGGDTYLSLITFIYRS